MTFATVRALGTKLPDVEVGTMYGTPALKLHGQLLACIASNKAAEPNTLAVRMGFDERDAAIAEDPDTYYLKDHYVPYDVVLVRLSKVTNDAMRDLLQGAWQRVQASGARKRRVSAAAPGRNTRRSSGRSRKRSAR